LINFISDSTLSALYDEQGPWN